MSGTRPPVIAEFMPMTMNDPLWVGGYIWCSDEGL